MSTDVTDWLHGERKPRNLYELLGRPLLDTDRVGLLSALRAANREVLDYQGHSDPAVANRALALLEELGRARAVLDDPAKLADHDGQVVQSLRLEFLEKNGATRSADLATLVQWLAREHGVADPCAGRIAELIRAVPETLNSRVDATLPPERRPTKVFADTETFRLADEGPRTEALPAKVLRASAPPPNSEPLSLDAEPDQPSSDGKSSVVETAAKRLPKKAARRRRRDEAETARRKRLRLALYVGAPAVSVGAALILVLVIGHSSPPTNIQPVTPGGSADATPPARRTPDGATRKITPAPTATDTPRTDVANLYKQRPADRAARASVIHLACTPDQRLAATSGADGLVRVWDVVTGEELRQFSVRHGRPRDAALPPAAGVPPTPGVLPPVAAIALSPDGRQVLLAIQEDRLSVRLWSAETGNELARFDDLLGGISALEFVSDGSRAVAVGGDFAGAGGNNPICLLDLQKKLVTRRLHGHSHLVTGLALSRDGDRALTGSVDGSVRLWDLNAGREIATFTPGDNAPATAIALSPDGRRAVVADDNGSVRVLEIPGGKQVAMVQLAAGSRTTGPFGPGPGATRGWAVVPVKDEWVAIAGTGDALRLWNIKSGEFRRRDLPDTIALRFSGDGSTALWIGTDAAMLVSVSDTNAFKIDDPVGPTAESGPGGSGAMPPNNLREPKTPAPLVRRKPVPSEAELQSERKQLQLAFMKELARPESEKKLDLVKKLRTESATLPPARRYVYLWEAKEIALSAGSIKAALTCIEDLRAEYEVDGLLLRVEAVDVISRRVNSTLLAKEVIEQAYLVADDAATDDRFDLARRALQTASAVVARAGASKKESYLEQISERKAHLQVLERFFPTAQAAEKKLEKSAQDPDACGNAGYYRCVLKGLWDEPNLRLLARGINSDVKVAASSDLLGREDTSGKVRLGDAWYDLARKQNGLVRAHLFSRARYWYDEAAAGLNGTDKTRVLKRVREIDQYSEALGLQKYSSEMQGPRASERSAMNVRKVQIKVVVSFNATITIGPQESTWSREVWYGEQALIGGFNMKSVAMPDDLSRMIRNTFVGKGKGELLGKFNFTTVSIVKNEGPGKVTLSQLGDSLIIDFDIGQQAPRVTSRFAIPFQPQPKLVTATITFEK